MSAAQVALKVNIATLELVRRLPLAELSAIGTCLATAFSDDEELVNILWVEVGNDTEREWRDAERSWDCFPGGPYQAYEMEEHSHNSMLRRSFRRFDEAERHRLAHSGFSSMAHWACFRYLRLSASSNESLSLRSDVEYSSRGLSQASSGLQHILAASETCVLPGNSDFFIAPSSWEDEDQDVELTAEELKAILRAERPPMTPSDSSSNYAVEMKAIQWPFKLSGTSSGSSDKNFTRGPWSPGKGTGPIMSSEEFDALPDYSDVEDDSHWDNRVSHILALNEFVELGEVISGRIW
ncbi:uncharacterized protein M421DRAFT_5826 [Didymella exigua CBS 183.55]|uniref:Uncharacterized protein n=1 Tax=Didymella exigua CBS 183.55 TaxID=1150837 RepID=A0A6A5RPX2_9PLEO|nr:uncharacterized protein M421DRAFT_5826 [Didymella exigua CBS 183.55]KAF1927537.1 hypothetical protein M421DRAFT_5826 [Didymella exigua CBS 183.55]